MSARYATMSSARPSKRVSHDCSHAGTPFAVNVSNANPSRTNLLAISSCTSTSLIVCYAHAVFFGYCISSLVLLFFCFCFVVCCLPVVGLRVCFDRCSTCRDPTPFSSVDGLKVNFALELVLRARIPKPPSPSSCSECQGQLILVNCLFPFISLSFYDLRCVMCCRLVQAKPPHWIAVHAALSCVAIAGPLCMPPSLFKATSPSRFTKSDCKPHWHLQLAQLTPIDLWICSASIIRCSVVRLN